MKYKGKVALITGASAGIGQATAKLMAKKGIKVAMLANVPDQVHEAADEIRGKGYEALPLVADVSQPDQMQAAIQQIVDEWGRIDIVFANAGINGVWASLEDLTPEDWDRTLNINLKGTFLTVKYCVPHLKARGGAVIVNASVNGTRMFGNTGATAYSSAKAGQVAFAKMTAVELGQHNIRVNAICPGWIMNTSIADNTFRKNVEAIRVPSVYPNGRNPLTGKKGGTMNQVAKTVLFLASDDSSHINGVEIYIDGGETLVQG
jgi:NAD(P)-dependent dehydrogenase (short-subunit alcohol dehydrogenase family)